MNSFMVVFPVVLALVSTLVVLVSRRRRRDYVPEPFCSFRYVAYLEYLKRLDKLSWWQFKEKRKLKAWLDSNPANKFNQ